MDKHEKTASPSPHFFRIILPHILENGTLELPKYFLNENWKHLSKHARLKVPNGEKSKMKLKMRNGRAWLHKGWQDFVEKYKIKCGYFLVFRYEGRSRFKVQIFDLSTLEIDYPRTRTGQENCKAIVQIKEEDCVYLDDDREMEVDNKSRKLRTWQNSSSIKDKSLARDRVLQRAMAFQSSNPHFIIIMQPSHVSRSNYSGLSIPKDGRSYFCKKGNKIMYLSLKGGDERVWSMKFKILAPRRRVRIYYPEWSKFSQENNLQEGDICVFEVVNSMDMEFKITILRITDGEVDENGPLANANISSPLGKLRSRQNSSSIKNKSLEISARDRVLQRAKAFQSPNPHFIVTMKPIYASYLHIPVGPARSYFPKKGNEDIKLSLKGGDGRVWYVKNCIGAYPDCRVKIIAGWSKFSRENNLQEGDICAFEQVNSKGKEFKVTIFRINDEQVDKKDPLVPRGMKEIKKDMQTRKRKRGVSVKEYTTPLQRANDFKFKCKEPSFTVMMRKTYVENYNCILLIPTKHASRYRIDQHGEEIFLNRLDGKTWPVKCYTSGTYTKMTKFCSGWKDFVADNDLQVGDACVFELLPHVSNHYKVTIFRVAV